MCLFAGLLRSREFERCGGEIPRLRLVRTQDSVACMEGPAHCTHPLITSPLQLSTNADGTAAWSAPVFLSAHELSLGVLVGEPAGAYEPASWGLCCTAALPPQRCLPGVGRTRTRSPCLFGPDTRAALSLCAWNLAAVSRERPRTCSPPWKGTPPKTHASSHLSLLVPPFVYAGAMDAQAIVLLNSEDALSQLKNK